MRKRYSIPTYRDARRLIAMLVALCLAACGNDTLVDDSVTGDGENGSGTARGEVTVVIAAPQTEARAINEETGDKIRTVRIYAYEYGKTDEAPVGYLEDNHFITGVSTYKMYIEKRGKLDFIALLNDGGAEQAAGQNITLDENTTRADIEKYRIGRQLKEYGTEGSGDYAIPMSTIEGTDGANRTFILTETTAPQYVNLTATRAMSRLRLYFAKADLGENDVEITEATLTQGPLSVRLTAEEDRESLPYDTSNEGYFDNDNATAITVVDKNNPIEVEAEIDEPDRTPLTAENTQLVATAYMPENPHGSSNTHDDGLYDGQYDGTGTADSPYLLTINYQAGTGNHTKEIYLPAVKRNQTVNIFGLLRGNKVELYVRVADWQTENVTLDDYPTYNDCGEAEGRSGYSTEARYVQLNEPPTGDELTNRRKAAFACTFNMSAPEGHEFTPILIGDGEARFTIQVWRDQTQITDPTDWVAGKGNYTIYVIPTQPYDEEHEDEGVNTVYLLITTRTWAGQADPLLINQGHQWNADGTPQDDRICITLKPSDISTIDVEEDTNP